jgi:hypothetical protein
MRSCVTMIAAAAVAGVVDLAEFGIEDRDVHQDAYRGPGSPWRIVAVHQLADQVYQGPSSALKLGPSQEPLPRSSPGLAGK